MKLYMVATPIGNLEDITYRAVRILGEVDVIACEDTRHTQTLLARYGIHKRTIACHAHNEEESAKGILALLDAGNDIAYVSDAGTPGISDPGARLVEYVRAESGHEIIPVPGPAAVSTLVSVSGNIGKGFVFEGFLSPKPGRRRKRLSELFAFKTAFVIYESPFRVLKTLEDISAAGPCRVIAGRELTKAFEEIISGSAEEVIRSLSERERIKGEFCLVIVPEALDDNSEEDPDA